MSKKYNIPTLQDGFTLIELLVVIAIVAIVMAISLFGLAGARESARNERRKSDLESIRSGLELYRADCDRYPASITFGGALPGGGPASTGKCATSNIYIKAVPQDPLTGSAYRYNVIGPGTSYEICSTLERVTSGTQTVSCGSTSCGSSSCYYKVTSP